MAQFGLFMKTNHDFFVEANSMKPLENFDGLIILYSTNSQKKKELS